MVPDIFCPVSSPPPPVPFKNYLERNWGKGEGRGGAAQAGPGYSSTAHVHSSLPVADETGKCVETQGKEGWLGRVARKAEHLYLSSAGRRS